MILASIPSPSVAVWHLGPLPIRAYAIAIMIGIGIAWWILDRRYRAKGGPSDVTIDIAGWAVIFGIVGGRIYHVITDNQLYFGEGRNPIKALYIWEGGLGIWGAIALGGVGVLIGCHRAGLRLAPVADSLAPALLVAQAIGRLGNYFNQELFGRETTLPWGLQIDDAHLPSGYASGTLFHPTFLYEMIWCLLGALALVALEKKFTLVAGQAFAAYVMIYTAGRFWIENMRIDEAHHILGLRLNVWTAILVFVGGTIALFVLRRRARNNPHANDIWLSEDARERFEKKRAAEQNGLHKSEESEGDSATDQEQSLEHSDEVEEGQSLSDIGDQPLPEARPDDTV